MNLKSKYFSKRPFRMNIFYSDIQIEINRNKREYIDFSDTYVIYEKEM